MLIREEIIKAIPSLYYFCRSDSFYCSLLLQVVAVVVYCNNRKAQECFEFLHFNYKPAVLRMLVPASVTACDPRLVTDPRLPKTQSEPVNEEAEAVQSSPRRGEVPASEESRRLLPPNIGRQRPPLSSDLYSCSCRRSIRVPPTSCYLKQVDLFVYCSASPLNHTADAALKKTAAMDPFRVREEDAALAAEAVFLDGIRELLTRTECKNESLAYF